MTSDNGEQISMRCCSPSIPFRPGLNGSSQTERRPFKQSSITRTRRPELFSLPSSTPGQRSSKGNRLRELGTMPHVNESEYTSTCLMVVPLVTFQEYLPPRRPVETTR